MNSPVPDTGQTESYTDTYGEDSDYTINAMSFIKLDASGNDLPFTATSWAMVRDNITGLVWEVKTAGDGTADYDNPHDANNTYTWYDENPDTNGGDAGTPEDGTDTRDFINAVNDEKPGGFSDWRIPTVEELSSIANYTNGDPAVDSGYFPQTVSATVYWSADISISAATSAFYLSSNGSTGIDSMDAAHRVRAVRSGQSKIGSLDYLVDNGNYTVTDTSTGLMWQQEGGTTEINWEGALDACTSSSHAGYTDWRLPAQKELRSVAALDSYGPFIDSSYFSSLFSLYWSGTTNVGDTALAWGIGFSDGQDSSSDKSGIYYTRAVRSGQPVDSALDHLVISTPVQGDIWAVGETLPITWDDKGLGGEVSIEVVSVDDLGTPTTTVASAADNTGSFDWTPIPSGINSMNSEITITPLSDPAKATTQGLFSIVSSKFEFTAEIVPARESDGTVSVFVVRKGDTTDAASVDYLTYGGTALQGEDYNAVSGTLTWTTGEGGEKSFVVDVLNDGIDESNETIHLYLTNASEGAAIGRQSSAVLTIDDDDGYIDNGDGTVTDQSTGLMWQQADDGVERTFEDACAYCDALEAAGYDDWRAPRVDELRSLVDYDQYSPAVDSVFSSDSTWYWSGSTYAQYTDYAWVVHFYNGYVDLNNKTDDTDVRCVRSGPYWSFDPLNYLVIKNDEVVEDVHTGFEWQRADDGVERTWSDACAYCDTLVLDGHDDWRIPEVEELNSIVDYTENDPATATEVFSSSSSYYWSGSTYANNTGNAWDVSFLNGNVDNYYKTHGNYVRCVRSGPYRSFDPLTPLVISLAVSDTSGAAPLTVDFRGLVGCGKPDYTYAWHFGDGGTSTERDPAHTFSSEGTYTVELTITDVDGNVATDTKEISILPSAASEYTLTVTHDDNGSVTLDPEKDAYTEGEEVTLTADPDAGYEFTGWSDDASGSTLTTTVTMTGDKAVTASFQAASYSLTVINSSNGTVTTDPDKSSYTYNEEVTLIAVPDDGYVFTEWYGDASGSSLSTTVTMTGDKSVTASFQAASYSLTVNSSNGTVTTDPDKSSYTYNEEVTLIAVPDDGYVFTEWSGDASGSSPSISLIMTADKTVTAFFGERYVVDYIEETVSDKSTGLMWQQEVDYVGGSLTFEDACDYCDALEAAGYTDWRAPRVDELRTIVDYTQYSPAFDSVFGKTISSYWSGSTLASNADDAWVVDFISGYVANYTKDSTSYVRCVRSGPYWSFDPLDYLVIKNDDVVEDVHTGLEWQRADVGVARDWSDACDYCDTLELDGHDDWRIPEVEELNTIVDYTDYGPAISTEVFNRSSMSYWSGSTNADNTDYAWVVDFYDGHVDSNNFINLGLDKGLKTSDYYVRCVRSALYRSFNSSTPLVISLAASDTSGAAPLTVDFRGLVGWGKPDYTYAWEFGDGGTSTERDPSHTFSSDGTYTVELTVTDADGNVATDTKEISVGLLDDGGTISGTIYEADGSTIADVGEDSGRIAVFTGDACGDNEDVRVSDGYPDASGHYAITGLPPGEYYIRSDLYETTYEDVWLDSNGGTADCSGALKVTVEAGEVAAGNDFYLGQTTRVEGYLYQQDGSYLEEGTSFHVKAYSGAPCGSKTYLPKTNAFNIYDGYKKYILKGLPPKTQIFLEASTRDDVYATEWWNSTTSTLECAEAEPIVLETGIDVRDKNFHLDPGSGDDDDDDSSSSGGGGGYVPPASNGTLEFTSAELSAVEGEGTLTLEVSRSDGRSGEVGVSYEVVAGGSAARDEDFSVADGTLTWEDRDDDIKTITVSILDDLVVEEAETFSLKLLNATGDASIGSVSEVEVTITDDAGEASRTPLEIYCSVTPASGMAPLDVTVTFDAAGGIPPLTYQIDYGDSETASADTSGILSHGYRETGTYQMIVTVTDSQGNQAESLHDITVSNTNTVQTMSAELSPEEKSGTVPLSVAFNTLIQGSSYPCLLVYDFGDGVTRDVILENTEDEGGTGVSHTYVQPGQYHAMVSVVDAKGRSAFSSAEIKVEKTGMDVAIVPSTYTGIAGTEGLSVSFAAEISSGMPPYTYAWHLEGGVTSDLPDPVHVFNTPGRFRVDLTVSDSQGATAAHAVEIRVYDFQKITIDPDAIHISDLDTEVVPLVKGYGSDGIWRELDAVSWQSSDPNVASVKQGRIAAVGQGATEITASYGALSAVINVEVDIQPVAIDLEPSFVSLGVDEIYTLSVYAAYADGSRKKLEDFTIDIPEESESVVKVDGHQITALSTGLAHLKVVSGANEASLVVYVAEDTLPLNISPSKVKCLPGSRVTVSIQGGTPPYRSVVGDVQGERWQVTVPGDPGEKVYTVKDSAGTVAPFTMTVLSPLTLVRSGAGTIEPGGMVYFSAGGGTPPCEWYATAGAIQSAAGNTSGASYQIPEVVGKYTVSVIDANGQSADYIVTNHPRLVLSPSQLYVAPGEQKRFSVIGGKPPYTVVTDTGKIFEDGEAFIYEAGKVKGDYEIRVSDAAGNQAGLHVQVSLPLWVSPQTAYLLPNNSKQFKLTGGVGKDEDIYIYALKGDVPAHPVNRGFEYTAPGETGQDVVMVTDSDGTHTRVEVEVISDKFFITPSRTALLQEETGYFRAVLGAGDSFAWSTEAGDILTCEESSSFIDYKAPLVKGSYALTCCDIQGNEAGAEVHVVDSTVVITPRVVYLSPEETCEFRAVFGTETYQFTYTDGSITPEKGSDDTVIYQAPGRIGEFFVTVFDSAGNQDQARVIVSSGERKPRLSDVEIHQIPLPLEKPDPSIQPMAAGSVQSGGKILDLAVDLPSYITDKDTAVPMNYYLGVLMEKAGVFFLLKPGGDVAFLDSPEPFLCNDIFTVYQRIFTEPIDLCNPGPVIPFDTYYLYVLAIESIYDPDNNLTFHPADAPYEFWQFFFEFKGCGEE